MRCALLLAVATTALAGGALAAPRSAGIKDPDTRAWFQLTEQLASDAMEGRDIGSPGFDRAADIVVQRFKAAGLKPAGDNGGWFQVFPVHEVKVEKAGIEITGPQGVHVFTFLRDFSVRAADDLPPQVEAPVVWAGYCRNEDLAAAHGKWVACLNTRRAGLTTGAQRIANARKAGAVGLIHVDDPYFTIEPARWPAAYARTVTIGGRPPPSTGGFPVLTFDYDLAEVMLGHTDLLAKRLAQPHNVVAAPFETGRTLKAGFKVSTRDYTAKNVVAVMPGADSKLSAEHLALSAHLDGYGFGEPVKGDGLYNGALDDAAYVATLVRFADKHRGLPLKRSVIFLVTTGEEKGLLGAHWFVDHPSVPKASIVADINLDQLRPLFPLKMLTQLGVNDSTLGADAKAVAATMGVRIQADPEPERSLMTRADHYPFIRAGIPATGFIFGYEPGTEAERRYREWYRVRYHRPQDDLTQPMDFKAAGDFNRFFYALAERVADAPERPAFTRAR